MNFYNNIITFAFRKTVQEKKEPLTKKLASEADRFRYTTGFSHRTVNNLLLFRLADTGCTDHIRFLIR